MNRIPVEEGRFSCSGDGLGTVTAEMVQRRAEEISVINGRERDNVLSSDIDEARIELQGREHSNPSTPQAEDIPEEERWDVPAGSKGTEAPTIPAPDEQTFAEKLVEEGVGEAEHDLEVQATEESLRRDKLE